VGPELIEALVAPKGVEESEAVRGFPSASGNLNTKLT